MNTPLILLWIFIFAGLVVLTILSLRNINQVSESKNVFTLNTNFSPCYPNNNVNELVSTNNQCCVFEGATTTQQTTFVDGLNFIIDTVPTVATEVCLSYCKNINQATGACKDSPVYDPNKTDNEYALCLYTLNPPNQCTFASRPIAQRNGTPYFAVTEFITGDSGNCPQLVSC